VQADRVLQLVHHHAEERGVVDAEGERRVSTMTTNPDKAIAALERALVLYDTAKTAAVMVADAKLALARALWPADKPRARQLATAARDAYRAGDSRSFGSKAGEADSWLRDH
jgi:hypothetical protein